MFIMPVVGGDELADTWAENWRDRHPAFAYLIGLIRLNVPEAERVLAYQRICQMEIRELNDI